MYLLGIIAAVLGALVALSIVWRYLSRLKSFPCPSSLAWMLELGPKESKSKRAIMDALALERGMRVADVGCGPGRLTIPIAEHVGPEGEVVAVDIQQRMLDRLERRITERGAANVRTLLAGAGDGKMPTNYFDRTLLVTVLGEIPDRERGLREIHGALKKGGILVIAELLGDPHYQRVKTLRTLAEKCGFEFGTIHSRLMSYTAQLHKKG